METKEMTQTEYRKYPAISASDIKAILDNPYLFKLGQQPKRTQAQQDRLNFGSAVHCLTLEPENFDRDFVAIGRGQRIAENEKRIVIGKASYDKALAVAEYVRDLPQFLAFKTDCAKEQSYFGEIEGVPIKCRPDILKDFGNRRLIVDIKTCSAGGLEGGKFIRSIAQYRYYIQAYVYMQITGAQRFVFLAVDIDNLISGFYELDSPSLEFGKTETLRALEIYKNLDKISSVVTNADDDFVQMVTLPNYVYYQNH